MNSIPKICIVGFTNIDTNIIPNRKPEILPGGAGYFAAIAASHICKPIGLVTRIGLDFDSDFLLSRVLHKGIHVIKNKNTSRYTITYHSDTDMSKRDIKNDLGVSTDLNPKDIPLSWLESTQYIHVAPMPPKQQALFISFLKNKSPNAVISTDTEESLLKNEVDIPLIKQNLMNSDIIFVNRVEWEKLKDVVNNHPFAVIKLDKDGAKCLKNGKEVANTPAPPVDVIDSTGAGDVLAGTFIASQLINDNITENLRVAVSIASNSVTQKGIQHLTSYAAQRTV